MKKMKHEIKPHNKAFKSTFVEKKKDVAIVTYGEKKVEVSMSKVKDKKAQAYRNQSKIVRELGSGFPLMSLEKVMEYLYGKEINKGMRSYW